MKLSIISFALLQGTLVLAHAHKHFHSPDFCAFISEKHLQSLVDNEDLSDEARQSANSTLQITQQVHRHRILQGSQGAAGAGASGEDGFIDNEDDQEYPQESTQNDEQQQEALQEAYNEADKGTPDPGSVETQKRRRNAKVSRQNSGLRRFIYNSNMNCDKTVSGQLVREEGSSTAVDNSVNSVYDALYWVDSLYRTIYNRNSYDNRGASLHARVHFCQNLNNAFWDGIGMSFGDADGITFNKNSFAMSQDVIGHEVTHGVIQRSNPLNYFSTTGALNEHLADVFGILSKQYRYGLTVNTDDWLLGTGIDRTGRAYRSMKNPSSGDVVERQPSNMRDYYTGSEDLYGVHINSGIPNYAFYLYCQMEQNNANYPVPAYAVPGHIWYNVLVGGQGGFSEYGETFQSFAQKTISAAEQLYGSTTAGYVYSAWQEVGVLT